MPEQFREAAVLTSAQKLRANAELVRRPVRARGAGGFVVGRSVLDPKWHVHESSRTLRATRPHHKLTARGSEAPDVEADDFPLPWTT